MNCDNIIYTFMTLLLRGQVKATLVSFLPHHIYIVAGEWMVPTVEENIG